MRLFAVAVCLVVGAVASAEAPRFRFEKDQRHTYRIVQTTRATETIPDEKTGKPVESIHVSEHTVIREWKVTDVDASGTATLEMSISTMRWEQKQPNGTTDVFDSTQPDDLNKNALAKIVGPVLAVLRVDNRGNVVEVKQSNFGPAHRFTSDLPFKVWLADKEAKEGDTWERSYAIPLDPPAGTGEKYATVQTYTRLAPENGYEKIGLTTTIKDLPTAAHDRIPLLPMLAEGTIYFDPVNGRMQAVRLKLRRELTDHQGEGSKYVYETTYAEDRK